MKNIVEAIFSWIGLLPAGILEYFGVKGANDHIFLIGIITSAIIIGVIPGIIKIIKCLIGEDIKNIRKQ